jgi:TetR/AcrR family transcriptional regulator, cholesterol catabolism regulator
LPESGVGLVRGVLHENVETAERVARGEGSSADKLELLLVDMMSSFERNYPAMYVYVEDLTRIARDDSEWARDISDSRHLFEDIVVGLLQDGQAEGSIRPDLPPQLTALALFGMVNWTHQWWRPKGKHGATEVAEVFATVFLKGAAAPVPSD